jgi:hypothetical protein
MTQTQKEKSCPRYRHVRRAKEIGSELDSGLTIITHAISPPLLSFR